MEQYRNHVGKVVEVLQKDGIKVQGTLKSVGDDETFVVTIKEKQRQEGKKRPVLVDVDKAYAVADVKYCKYLLNFK